MDLDALLSALQSEQAKKSATRLSERNVVELVLKLKQLGLFGDELLHTINGKEYITTQRLKADIQAALRAAGGRLELTELPALVGVDLVHCEKQAALIVAESGGSVLDAQGELITTQYFDSLAAEVNDLLQESGVLSMADLAISYALNTELLRETLAGRMGSVIAGQLEGGLLFTPAYIRNIKAQLRGGLRGAAAPVSLPVLVRGLGLDSAGASPSLLAQLVDELLAERALAGSTKGGGGSWVPAIHTAAQQGAIAGFYRQNGWVGYDLARKAGVTSERAYLRQAFPDGVALESVFVSPSLIAQVDAAVAETLANDSWLDVSTVLPPSLAVGDAVQLLEQCSELARDSEHKRGQVLASTCVVGAGLIAGAKERVAEFGRQEADRVARTRSSAAAGTSGGGAAPEAGKAAAANGGGKKAAASSPAKQRADASGADSDDDWSMGSKKGRKGKGGGGGKGAKAGAKAAGGGGAKGAAAQHKGGGTDVASLLSLGVLTQQVLELHPDMEDAGPSGGLAKALAELLRPAAVAAYQEALASVFTSTAEARRKAKDTALKAADEAFTLLQLYAHGCELLQADEATLALVQRSLLRGTGGDALDALLSWCQLEFAEQDAAAGAAEAAAAAPGVASLSPAERSRLVKALPPEVAQPLGRVLEASNGTDPQELVAQLEAAAAECGIRLRRLDKKAEKAALASHKARLAALLEAEHNPAAALALALPLLALKASGRLLTIPGRAISGVLAALQPDLPEEQFALVQRFHGLVVEALKRAAGGGEEGGALQQQLAEELPALKAVAGVQPAP